MNALVLQRKNSYGALLGAVEVSSAMAEMLHRKQEFCRKNKISSMQIADSQSKLQFSVTKDSIALMTEFVEFQGATRPVVEDKKPIVARAPSPIYSNSRYKGD